MIFLSSQLLYAVMAVWLYTSGPWKARIWANIPLTLWLVLVIGVNMAFFWLTPHLSAFFNLVDVRFLVSVTFTLTMEFTAFGSIWAFILDKIYKGKE